VIDVNPQITLLPAFGIPAVLELRWILTSPPRAAGWLRCFWLHGFWCVEQEAADGGRQRKDTPHRMNVEVPAIGLWKKRPSKCGDTKPPRFPQIFPIRVRQPTFLPPTSCANDQTDGL